MMEENKKACPFLVASMGVSATLAGLLTRVTEAERAERVEAVLQSSACLREVCAMWNEAAGRCGLRTDARSVG